MIWGGLRMSYRVMSCGVWEGLPSPDCQGLETFPTKRS